MSQSSIPWNGYYDELGRHVCKCGEHTRYAAMSGGREFYCEHCGNNGFYPEGEGGPRARLLNEGRDGIAALRAQMDQEIARRKEHRMMPSRKSGGLPWRCRLFGHSWGLWSPVGKRWIHFYIQSAEGPSDPAPPYRKCRRRHCPAVER